MSNLAYRLDGNATDPDGGSISSFRWTILTVPEGGVANIEEDDSGPTTPRASLFINNGCVAQGTYTVKLAAQDDDSQTGSDVVTINVNQPLLNTTTNATINPVANLTTNQTLATNSTSGNVTSGNSTTSGPINGPGTFPGVIVNGTDGNTGNVTESLVESPTANQSTSQNNNNSSRIQPQDSLKAGITNGTESSTAPLSSLAATSSASTIEGSGNGNNDTNDIIDTQIIADGNKLAAESLMPSISPIIASTDGSSLLASSYYSTLDDIMAYEDSILSTDNLGRNPSGFEKANLDSRYADRISESTHDYGRVEESDKGEETTSAITATGNVNLAILEQGRLPEDVFVEDNLLGSGQDDGSVKSETFTPSLAERIRDIESNDISAEISSALLEKESDNVNADTREKEPDSVAEEKEPKETEDEDAEQKEDCQSEEIYDSDSKECKPCPSDEKPNDGQTECIKDQQEVKAEQEEEKKQESGKRRGAKIRAS